MVRTSFRARYGQSMLGMLWIVLYPAVFLAIYGLVYVRILEVRVPGLTTEQYVLSIFCGLVPFLAFSEALGTGSQAIIGNRTLLKNTLIPVELIVARDVLVPHVGMLVGLSLIAIASTVTGGPWWGAALALTVVPMQIATTLGAVWLVACILVFFRDLQQAVPIIVIALMLLSPIAYTTEMVPEPLRITLIANPLAWIISAYRTSLLEGTLDLNVIIVMTTFSIVAMKCGYHVLTRLKPLIVDHV